MNIAILGLTATSYGNLTYLKNFLPELQQLDSANNYEVFLPAANIREWDLRQQNFHLHFPRSAPKSGVWRVAWEQLVFPLILRARGVEAVYTTNSMAILLSPVPSIISVQNVEPFFAGQFPGALGLRPRLWLLRMIMGISLRRSHRIVAISDWEKDFLVERFHLSPEKIAVTYPGVTEDFHPPAPGSAVALREHLGIEPPYILSAPHLARYGNLLNLAKAYVSLVKAGRIDMPLVVPGGVWDSRYIDSVKHLLATEGCAERVKFLGYVAHQQMPLLFGHAACFVFPSLLEACGTVLVEALACGTPILCCRRPPMSNVCGDAAVLFDGEDPNDIAAKLYEVLADSALREALSRRAVARAKRFSWREGAQKVHEVFREMARSRGMAGCGAASIPHDIPQERRS